MERIVPTNIEPRFRELLAESEFDAIIASSRENVIYLSGVRNLSHDHIPSRKHFVVWPKQGEPVYVCISSEKGMAEGESRVRNFRTYVEFSNEPEDVVMAVLKEMGLDGKCIGFEERGCTKETYDRFRAGLPSNRLMACDELFEKSRMVKTPEEVRLLTRATEATERAVRMAFASTRPGDTERDIHNRMAKHLIDEGCENVAWLVLAAGANAHVVHPKASDYRIKEGDLVWVDVGAWFDGYLADIGRVAVVGQGSERQRICYDKLMAVQDAVINSVRPGIRFKDLYWTIVNSLESTEPKVSLPNFPHFGHILGVGVHEYPMITADCEEELLPGMVICIEPCFVDDNGDVYHDEELVHVTATAHEVLTPRRHWRNLYEIA